MWRGQLNRFIVVTLFIEFVCVFFLLGIGVPIIEVAKPIWWHGLLFVFFAFLAEAMFSLLLATAVLLPRFSTATEAIVVLYRMVGLMSVTGSPLVKLVFAAIQTLWIGAQLSLAAWMLPMISISAFKAFVLAAIFVFPIRVILARRLATL